MRFWPLCHKGEELPDEFFYPSRQFISLLGRFVPSSHDKHAPAHLARTYNEPLTREAGDCHGNSAVGNAWSARNCDFFVLSLFSSVIWYCWRYGYFGKSVMKAQKIASVMFLPWMLVKCWKFREKDCIYSNLIEKSAALARTSATVVRNTEFGWDLETYIKSRYMKMRPCWMIQRLLGFQTRWAVDKQELLEWNLGITLCPFIRRKKKKKKKLGIHGAHLSFFAV